MAAIAQLSPGLYRWTARHPAWQAGPEPESVDDWPADVGCVAYAAPGALVLVDPLVPGDDADGFWAQMDRLVASREVPVRVLTTVTWHGRSRDELVARYAGEAFDAQDARIEGVVAWPVQEAGETMVWLPGVRALVPGDRLIGDGGGGLRMCPESWLRYLASGLTLDGLRERLRPLLELPVESVLVSHGEPVLRDGRAAIAAALA